jgi:hypothetical protein
MTSFVEVRPVGYSPASPVDVQAAFSFPTRMVAPLVVTYCLPFAEIVA